MAEASRKKRRKETPKGEPDAMKAGYASAELKNEAVRRNLEPLEPGERPAVVTVGAVFSGLVAAIFWVSAGVALFTGAEVNGVRPNVAQLVLTAGIMTVMAIGMWKAKYWAVLGFQMLLVLFILAAIAGLITAGTLVQMISTLLLTVGLSVMFWFMVKAMARIQMPQRP